MEAGEKNYLICPSNLLKQDGSFGHSLGILALVANHCANKEAGAVKWKVAPTLSTIRRHGGILYPNHHTGNLSVCLLKTKLVELAEVLI